MQTKIVCLLKLLYRAESFLFTYLEISHIAWLLFFVSPLIYYKKIKHIHLSKFFDKKYFIFSIKKSDITGLKNIK